MVSSADDGPAGCDTIGTSVTATATISRAPPDGEIVTFNLSGTITWNATATSTGGKATVTVPTGTGSSQIPGGTYNAMASYPGDTTLAASTSTAATFNVQDFTVGPNSLSITVSSPTERFRHHHPEHVEWIEHSSVV